MQHICSVWHQLTAQHVSIKALLVHDFSVEAMCHYVGSCSAHTIAVHSQACCIRIHWRSRSGTVKLNIDDFLLKQYVIASAVAFPCVARALQ